MANMTQAYTYLANSSLFEAANEAYAVSVGIFFWPIIFMFTLFLVYIKTESPAYVAVYAIIGNVALAALLPILTHTIFYTTIVFSIALTLWSFFGSNKIE